MTQQNRPLPELIAADIQISRILTVYYGQQTDWARPAPAPRYAHGVILVTGGSIRYRFGQETCLSGPGDVLVFPKGAVYSGVSLSPVNSFYVIDFETAEESGFGALPLPRVLRPESAQALERSFSGLLACWNRPEIGSRLRCKAALYQLLCDLLLLESAERVNQSEYRFVSEAVEWIRRHFADPDLYIGQIAKEKNISESQLRRLFQKVLHVSPLEYLTSVRIQHARNLLLYSSDPVSEIAEKSGFSSFYYFSRAFKQSTGLSPSRLRRIG